MAGWTWWLLEALAWILPEAFLTWVDEDDRREAWVAALLGIVATAAILYIALSDAELASATLWTLAAVATVCVVGAFLLLLHWNESHKS